MNYLALILIQATETPFDYTKLIGWITAGGIVISAVIYLIFAGTKQLHETQTTNVKSLTELLTTREKQLNEEKEKTKKLTEELAEKDEALSSITLEYKSLAGIVIHELLDFVGMKIVIRVKEDEMRVLTDEYSKLNTKYIQLKLEKGGANEG